MKRALALLLALGLLFEAAKCEAAEKCYPPNATNVELTLVPESKALWLVMPGANQHLTYWCDLNYQWHYVAISGYRKNLVGDWFEKAAGFEQLDDAGKAALIDSIVKGPIDATYPELKPIQEALRKATEPLEIRWNVKRPTGTCGLVNGVPMPCVTRPYYLVVNGVRRTTKAGDVSWGQPCKCWNRPPSVKEGDSDMCDVSGVPASPFTKLIPPDHVALCVRQ